MPPRRPPRARGPALADRAAATHDEVWVAEVDGAVGGVRAASTRHWLDDLYVAPARAGQGLGCALLDLVKAQRPDGFCLWVFEMNTPGPARSTRARGLVELEHTDGSGNEEKQPDVRMAWPGDRPARRSSAA